MSTRYSFNKSTLRAFERKYDIGIDFDLGQETQLDRNGKTTLTIPQISDLLKDLCPTEESIVEFIQETSKNLVPISLTLFVINEATWKIMENKPKFPDKLLPMSMIPWFYWDPYYQRKGNPRGIRRHETGTCVVSITNDLKELILTGTGGDFSGLIEELLERDLVKGRSIFPLVKNLIFPPE